jgi:hypothetical protein
MIPGTPIEQAARAINSAPRAAMLAGSSAHHLRRQLLISGVYRLTPDSA